MNKTKLIREITAAVKEMRNNHENGTYYWRLATDENDNDWAIVLGWADGFEEDENDDCTDGAWRICIKLATQPGNSCMQCDYDIDWLMPYNENTGDVDDNEISIYPDTDIKSTVNWLLDCFDSYEITED